jgi:hypothetical protein
VKKRCSSIGKYNEIVDESRGLAVIFDFSEAPLQFLRSTLDLCRHKCENYHSIMPQFLSYFPFYVAIMSQRTIVITNCTNRKRVKGALLALDESALKRPLAQIANDWCRQVQLAETVAEAQEVYGGRSIADAKEAARLAQAELFIISAGLGLVRGSEQIPAYDLTVTAGEDSIASVLKREGKQAADWWELLVKKFGPQRSVKTLVQQQPGALIFLALPSSYLRLIERELEQLKAVDARLRIITSAYGADQLPSNLRSCVLPYDERLNGSKYAGTRNDFPQRALLHFVRELEGTALTLTEAQDKVKRAMSRLHEPIQPERVRKTDEELRALLRKHWNQHHGSAGRLLRFLRDDALVSCEQGRFRGLWKELQAEFITRG